MKEKKNKGTIRDAGEKSNEVLEAARKLVKNTQKQVVVTEIKKFAGQEIRSVTITLGYILSCSGIDQCANLAWVYIIDSSVDAVRFQCRKDP